MPDPHKISVSILSADFTSLGEQIAEAEAAGADWIHVDVMDGHFVPNLTMGPFIVEACRRATQLPLDVHLMVEAPERLIQAFAQAGATYLTVHVENNPNLYRTMQAICELGCKPGVVLNPGTPASTVFPVLPLADMVLVMSVNPGYSGQKFIPAVLPKVTELSQAIQRINPQTLLEIDGGMNIDTLPQARSAGAQVFVAANAIFNHPQGITAGIQALRGCI